ncbi:hypothetical protein BegalDRAFT_1469 [Beggiatoa alba B18LD]|uniref:Uncharacterized protein n=1 Tax=Beggiatoa alba B18LD TaxID=395493 RepID=I3CFG4_9GAMM|nr:hypothetical protein [Beggiatoa alba]EIJ42357.1 hypothetical protein BegalDRAFT_1469 [Beggiatoa alba B18LD]
MFNPETGEVASDGLYAVGELRKVIEKADFTDKETGTKRPGGFEIEMLLENLTGRDQLLIAKSAKPEQFTGLLRQRIVVAIKTSAYQFGERDAQISYTVQDDIPPIRLSNLISAQAYANPPVSASVPPPVPVPEAVQESDIKTEPKKSSNFMGSLMGA